MLETKHLKFASRSLEPGVGASASLGTVGDGVAATMHQKRDVSEKDMVHLFSPSPTFTDISCNGGGSSSYAAAKESKVAVDSKLLCLKEQMDYHKYVLMSDSYDADKKKKLRKN
jgi:hypothetical protein